MQKVAQHSSLADSVLIKIHSVCVAKRLFSSVMSNCISIQLRKVHKCNTFMNVKPFRYVMVHCQVLHFNTMTCHVEKAKHLPYITTATNQSKEKENIPLTSSACNLVQQLRHKDHGRQLDKSPLTGALSVLRLNEGC